MKQTYCLIMLLGCSLPIIAMENPNAVATTKKEEIEMKQPTEDIVIEVTKEPAVSIFMQNVGLTGFVQEPHDFVQDELEGMSPERYNKLVAKVNYVKPADPRSYVLAQIIRAMRNQGLTVLGRYRMIACLGWTIGTAATLTLSGLALFAAANS